MQSKIAHDSLRFYTHSVACSSCGALDTRLRALLVGGDLPFAHTCFNHTPAVLEDKQVGALARGV